MCDIQCSLYGDCCKDSGILNSKSDFKCISTAQDGSVYMKTSCPSTWKGSPKTKYYCEDSKSFDNKLDIPLVIPVTSENNITYRNLFCGICNGDDSFEFWKIGVWVAHGSSLNDSSVDKSVLLTDHIKVISIKGVIPPELVDRVRYCQPDVIDSCPPSWNGTTCPKHTLHVYHDNKTFKNIECLRCNEPNLTLTHDICIQPKIKSQITDSLFLEDSFESFLEAANFCSETSQHDLPAQVLCTADASALEIDRCSSPHMCEIDTIFDINDENIQLIGNDTIFLKSRNLELVRKEERYQQWIILNESSIYVCGKDLEQIGFLTEVSAWLTDILIKLSMVCLILHLIAVQQLPKLRNIPGKSLAAYSFSLLIAFICLDLDPEWGLCKYTAVILHFSLLSCFTWMLLMAYNCWLATYRATKLRKRSEKKSRKFLYYTLIAFLIPLLIVSIGIYLETASIEQVPCEWKPRYGAEEECLISGNQSFVALFIIPSSILFVINNLFFAHTAYLIYHNQRHNTITQQEQINFKLYIRLALIMGSTWIFGSLYTFTEWTIIQILFVVLNMSQGIFIFIAFTLQKRNLKMLRSKYEQNTRIAAILTWCLGEKNVPDEVPSESLRLK